jgi:broad specificity phosphatase PhoE
MTITVHLVRHAQGFHNLNTINQQIPDPYLTPTGKEQCLALRNTFPHHDRLTHLVASPMRRTLQTCEQSFRPAVDRGLKVVAQPLVQEVSTLPCDTGSEPEVLAAEFGEWADVSGVPKGWNDKTSPGSPWAPQIEALEERARKARVWLRDLGRRYKAEGRGDSADIVVTTHGGFLHFLTLDWEGMNINTGMSEGCGSGAQYD